MMRRVLILNVMLLAIVAVVHEVVAWVARDTSAVVGLVVYS